MPTQPLLQGGEYRCPPFRAGVVVGENKQAILAQHAMGLAKHRGETIGKLLGLRMLDLVRRSRCRWLVTVNVALPNVEEVGQLGVVHVVEERGISHDKVYRTVWEVRDLGRASAEIELTLLLSRLRP